MNSFRLYELLKQLTNYFMLHVMFYAIVTSGPVVEHNNSRLNTIGLQAL